MLEAPFTSIVDVGRLMWKGFPLSLIMADQYRTIDRIGAVKAPLFIIHGGRDAIIPLDQARQVFHAADEPKSMAVVPQAGHNDLFDRGAWESVRGFLDALRPGAGGRPRAGGGSRSPRRQAARRGSASDIAIVMPGLKPGIHEFIRGQRLNGRTGPAMTDF